MVENSTPTPLQTPSKGLPVTSMVLGIISLMVPILGLIAAVLAIVLAIVAFHQKTPYKGYAIAGIVTGAVAILMSLALFVVFSWLASGSLPLLQNNPRDKAVQAMVESRKDFVLGETAVIGSHDVTVTSVQRNYALTADEQKEAYKAPREYDLETGKRTVIDEADAEYVAVTVKVTNNGSENLDDGRFDFADWQLNDVTPYYVAPLSATDREQTYVYRIRKGAEKLVLENIISIFTSVSPIVGTEGMPRKTFTYTFTLN